MRFEFRNVGKVSHAAIDLLGLNVIAGVNDSGKSTIGKTIFAFIKDLNTTKEAYFKEAEKKSLQKFLQIYFILRHSANSRKILAENANLFDPETFLEEINAVSKYDFPISTVVSKRQKIIEKMPLSSREREKVLGLLSQLEKLFSCQITHKEIIVDAVKSFMASEFKSQINNALQGKESEIKIFLNDRLYYCFSFIENNLTSVQIPSESSLPPMEIKDVTFIESPAFLPLIDILRDLDSFQTSDTPWRAQYGPLHLKDFAQKMLSLRFATKKPFISDWESKIEDIISGKFIFDEDTENLFFQKNETHLNTINTAIGVRSFGILDILNRVGVINPSSMLIIDEPETHLHPEWQLKYAQLLVELVCSDIPVLVTSHSPYMIEALRSCAATQKILSRTHFYLSKKQNSSFCKMNELKGNLEPIFEALARPLHQLLMGKF